MHTLADLFPNLALPQARPNPYLQTIEQFRQETALKTDPWKEQRRPAQTPPPGDWQTWLVMAGRGFGKTRTGAEWVREEIMANRARIIHFIAATAADARDVMIEGPAGFLKVCEAYGWHPKYEPSKRQITCPNGAIIKVFSAEEPERLRGPQCDLLWADEIGAWKNATYTWDMAQMGLRLGTMPRQIATTTPRATPLVKSLVDDEYNAETNPDGTTVITGGSTFENAKNLAKSFLARIRKTYEGTRLGEQELQGKLLLDIPGALWSATLLEEGRIILREGDPNPRLNLDLDIYRMAVGVDPMTKDPKQEANLENPSETGIVVAGLGPLDHGYVFEDASMPGTPAEWGTQAVRMYHKWRCDHIVAEANNGGMMVKHTIETIDPNIPVHLVHASRGKIARAEPVSSIYQQLRAHHVGVFPKLEEQMTTYEGVPGEHSPDRLDALVWVMTDMMIGLGSQEIQQDVAELFDWTGTGGW